MELKKYRLGDVAEILISSIDKKSKDGEAPVRLCNFVDVYRNWAVTANSIQDFMVATTNENNLKKFSLKKGYVAFTKDSETRHDIGISTYIADDLVNTVLGYHCALVKPNNSILSGKYLNAFLHSGYIKKYFELNASGSGMRYTLSIDTLNNTPILAPSVKIQERIGHIFSDIDRKICLNRQINDNLEAMAKLLYDYWFVQFDFPNEDGKPYKSSGGAMVWNEKLKREIPQGWSDCVLGDYIGRITNGLNPRKNFVLGSGNNYYVTIRSLVGTTIDWNNCDRCDDEALSKINSRSQLQIGDIIFSAIGTIGRTYYILEEPTNWNISETSFTLRAKENVPNDFFYGMLRSNEIQIKADKAAMGSTLRCLVMDSLCSLQYIKIPSYMMKLFAAKVSPLYRQIHRNNKEIAELTKQRDELLPLLMNGQATVNYHLSAY